MNRWWYSEKQKQVEICIEHKCHKREVLVNNKWQPYTEWTTSLNGKCNWDDAILVVESSGKLPIKVNGVLQGQRL